MNINKTKILKESIKNVTVDFSALKIALQISFVVIPQYIYIVCYVSLQSRHIDATGMFPPTLGSLELVHADDRNIPATYTSSLVESIRGPQLHKF